MPTRELVTALLFCGIAFAQNSPEDLVVLPASSTDAPFDLTLPDVPPDADVKHLALTDAQGKRIWPQPTFGTWMVDKSSVHVSLSNVQFWGQARLPVQTASKRLVYSLRRGPSVTPVTGIKAGRNAPAELWLYNFESQPLTINWQLASAGTADGKWTSITLGAVRSERILVPVPSAWFPWIGSGEQPRMAELQLQFGTAPNAPMYSVPLALLLEPYVVPAPWASAFSGLWTLITIFVGVTLGAIFLMLAQVMIPNFRQVLGMETQADALQERLRAISEQVGNRLLTRCIQELERLRFGMAMAQKSPREGFLWWSRLLLSGNTSEVDRLAGVVSKLERRIQLTERLDEVQTAFAEIGAEDLPPTVFWNQGKQLAAVQAILARQLVTDADEKTASSYLDALSDDSSWTKAFAADLETRIAALRRQLLDDCCKDKVPELIKKMNCCGDLLKDQPPKAPDGGWTTPELIARDLCAVRLEMVRQMIMLEGLISATERDRLLTELQSADPSVLHRAQLELIMISEGVFEDTIKDAFQHGLCDSYMEPTTVTNQDVIRASLVFREKRLQRSTAKTLFLCEWAVSSKNTEDEQSANKPPGQPSTGNTAETESPEDAEDKDYEQGWQIQLIRAAGEVTLAPHVYDAKGDELKRLPPENGKAANEEASKKVAEKPADDKTKDSKGGVLEFPVSAPDSNPFKRLFRGFIEAVLTALVPVATVALTQFNSQSVGFGKLLVIGFTSQAIRAAVIPESVIPGADQPPKTSTGAT
jgi:hypothetical protein